MSEPFYSYAVYKNPKDLPGKIVVRKWAIMSAHEKTLENYENTRNND